MQDTLFEDRPPPPRRRAGEVRPAEHGEALHRLREALPPLVRIGTSSWTYPGWEGIVWAGAASETQLSKHGLAAYARHPVLRTVCVDRSFYRALSAAQYAAMAVQVPADFRFMVKAPASVTDAVLRGEDGRAEQPNPFFLDAGLAVADFIEPALEGLADRCGPLIFQLSPLPLRQLADPGGFWGRLDAMLGALPALRERAPDAVIAVEVRDSALLGPELARILKRHGATYCLGLHAKLPPLERQLPLLRALWPGPLVVRWNYHRRHGPYGYEVAESAYAPFDRIVDPDPATREALARVMAGTAGRGQNVFVGISNKAEGSAPLSVVGLAEALVTPTRSSPAAC